MDDYGMDNQSKQGKEYEPEQECTSTTNEESICYDPTERETCDQPAVWGQVNKQTGATIWHCQTHTDLVMGMRF